MNHLETKVTWSKSIQNALSISWTIPVQNRPYVILELFLLFAFIVDEHVFKIFFILFKYLVFLLHPWYLQAFWHHFFLNFLSSFVVYLHLVICCEVYFPIKLIIVKDLIRRINLMEFPIEVSFKCLLNLYLFLLFIHNTELFILTASS